ncbi:nucleoside triphosphate pyrophosphohydrolase [Salinivibrio sp. ML323]|uniref:Nucleoside triphosphate pyrophosphohydrolase n=1 Tax=Salinivibrio kushneri TaxID=1908198 RepID=A0AB36K524_9GAMM|nr:MULTISPECIES: nucleoside triphosphate pyrophosphohydrolase [Salinivibrio]OOE43276.1 nucleoside triphosphate pyrophosphohydrolase [Salinivibrio kushneri]OOE60430.1 nucleoside triphosphate pyrophosphohydrolase [Salinivibrio sp. ML323]
MAPIEQLLTIMATLRDPDKGCDWDNAQHFASIVPHTLEEAYEVADAIERENWSDLKDELGDLLFQIVFYSQLGREENQFDFEDVVRGICDKLIRRHPHVFGPKDAQGQPLMAADWEGIKAQERAESAASMQPQSVLDGVTQGLPALTRAYKLQKRCARVGFDWPTVAPVIDKVQEEIEEVEQELAQASVDQARVDEEVGDLLFAVVNLARHLGTDAEQALRRANQKFEARFRGVEKHLRDNEKNIQQCQLDELESAWQAVKKANK